MLKRLTFIVALIALLCSSYGYVRMFSPVDSKLVDNEDLLIGKAQPGESFEIIFARETGIANSTWDTIQIRVPSEDWKYTYEKQEKNFIVKVTVPKTAKDNIYNITVGFANDYGAIEGQKVNAKVSVEKGLLKLRVKRVQEFVEVGKKADFVIDMENTSIGSHKIRLGSDLSNAWFVPRDEEIAAKSSKKIEISVIPRAIGIKRFYFKFDSLITNEEIARSQTEVGAKPSLGSKFSNSAYGLPFLDSTLMPQRLLFATIAVLFQ